MSRPGSLAITLYRLLGREGGASYQDPHNEMIDPPLTCLTESFPRARGNPLVKRYSELMSDITDTLIFALNMKLLHEGPHVARVMFPPSP